eukprot:TRINITY_DN1279_c0_g2_i2.p1 TRINITY_DN1279_c0_g2~~TRINITY_DN1279_c0_g2_i2.p1  ORF type:complete len:442 (+),score=117.28 TRINITY_DN1279_c0_g2_i2:115-1326(+)
MEEGKLKIVRVSLVEANDREAEDGALFTVYSIRVGWEYTAVAGTQFEFDVTVERRYSEFNKLWYDLEKHPAVCSVEFPRRVLWGSMYPCTVSYRKETLGSWLCTICSASDVREDPVLLEWLEVDSVRRIAEQRLAEGPVAAAPAAVAADDGATAVFESRAPSAPGAYELELKERVESAGYKALAPMISRAAEGCCGDLGQAEDEYYRLVGGKKEELRESKRGSSSVRDVRCAQLSEIVQAAGHDVDLCALEVVIEACGGDLKMAEDMYFEHAAARRAQVSQLQQQYQAAAVVEGLAERGYDDSRMLASILEACVAGETLASEHVHRAAELYRQYCTAEPVLLKLQGREPERWRAEFNLAAQGMFDKGYTDVDRMRWCFMLCATDQPLTPDHIMAARALYLHVR